MAQFGCGVSLPHEMNLLKIFPLPHFCDFRHNIDVRSEQNTYPIIRGGVTVVVGHQKLTPRLIRPLIPIAL